MCVLAMFEIAPIAFKTQACFFFGLYIFRPSGKLDNFTPHFPSTFFLFIYIFTRTFKFSGVGR